MLLLSLSISRKVRVTCGLCFMPAEVLYTPNYIGKIVAAVICSLDYGFVVLV